MRVLIADDEAPARDRLRRLLEALPDLEIVGEARSGREALDQIAALSPDLIMLDIEMPELDGLALAERCPQATVVFVTAHEDYAVRASTCAPPTTC